MLFRRRDPEKIHHKVRVAFWPRRSWNRSKNYVMLRLRRLDGSAHKIALGAACGVLISFTPFFGFHFILAALLAYLCGGSLIASALGTFFGNPITFPFIGIGSYNLGSWLLGFRDDLKGNVIGHIMEGLSSWDKFKTLLPVIESYALGGVILGTLFAIPAYFILRKLIRAYKAKRKAVLENRSILKVKKQPQAFHQ